MKICWFISTDVVIDITYHLYPALVPLSFSRAIAPRAGHTAQHQLQMTLHRNIRSRLPSPPEFHPPTRHLAHSLTHSIDAKVPMQNTNTMPRPAMPCHAIRFYCVVSSNQPACASKKNSSVVRLISRSLLCVFAASRREETSVFGLFVCLLFYFCMSWTRYYHPWLWIQNPERKNS